MGKIDLFESMKEKIKNGMKYSSGEMYALYNYQDSVRHNSSEFEVTETPSGNETATFLRTIYASGVTTFILTEKSTTIIEFLHAASKYNWNIAGLDFVTRVDTEFNVMDEYQVEGVRISYQYKGDV